MKLLTPLLAIKKSIKFIFIVALVSFSVGNAHAEEPIAKRGLSGVVIGGHDSVAYHVPENIQSHTAQKGKKTYTVKYKGGNWRFASQEHARLFEANPDKYAPAYNGHCANALSLGEGLIRTDGSHWEIFEDQLYVFFAARGRDRWTDGNFEQYKKEADRAWQEILANQ